MAGSILGRRVPASLGLLLCLGATGAAGDVVSHFDLVATNAINATNLPAVSAAEQRPFFQGDLAAVHVAMYDAAVAVEGGFAPFAAKGSTTARGASLEAAVATAACTVLRERFPGRAPVYEKPCADALAALPDGDAKSRGVAAGREAGRAMAELRRDDGRMRGDAYAPVERPGAFRPSALPPIGFAVARTKPFALTSAAQFRPPGPPALASAAYAADFAEVKALGAATGASLTADQQSAARFHTEPPPLFLPRNVRRLADDSHPVLANARLMAMAWVALADASIACFEAKYHYDFWRPRSAIPLADTDDNPATVADAQWRPLVPTPNHPEYPAAHGCTAGALGAVLRSVRGERIGLAFDSAATGTTRRYEFVDDLVGEMAAARIHGGMHFRTSVEHGTALGASVGQWVVARHFLPMPEAR